MEVAQETPTVQAPHNTGEEPRSAVSDTVPRHGWKPALAVGVAALILAALLKLAPFASHTPPTGIVASGRIEARDVTVAPKDIQARVAELKVDEGETVARGQLLAVLAADQLDARRETLTANLHAIDAQIAQAKLDVIHTDRQVNAAVAGASAAVAAATATTEKARAVRDNTTAQYKRMLLLLDQRVISQAEFDQATTSSRSAEADVNAAVKAREQADANLVVAEAARDTVMLKQRQVEALEANRRALQSQMAELNATQAERRVLAPSDGTIVSRAVEVGDVVSPGSPLFTLVDMDRLYLKVYIPEPDIPKVTLGAGSDVTVDAFPGRVFSGRVTKISDRAEFTPKNVETADERVKLVFGVEVSVANRDRLLKPGMPADCRIAAPPPNGAPRHAP